METVGVGALTFLFTDIEHSTRLWADYGDLMGEALNAHDQSIAMAVQSCGGRVFKHTGDGACAVFDAPENAMRAAAQAQRALAEERSGNPVTLRARMGVHSGPALARGDDFFGPALNRTARVMEAAHGGQVLVSAASAALATPSVAGELGLLDLGEHRLRDLAEPERLYQLTAQGLDDSFPPPRSLDVQRHRLPVMRSSFVGRDQDVQDVAALLVSHRQITLTGVGGTGKTRLALEVATGQLDRFVDGVFFVDLAAIADPGLVMSTLADAMGLQRGNPLVQLARRPLDELVFEALESKTVLIILDNCEHLLDAAAELADAILTRCTAVTVLATSREALEIEGEQSYRVPSLSVQGEDAEAVRLFHLRAVAVRPDLILDQPTQAAVAEVCVRLDGIPLAIELAAAQVGHLTPQEIAAHLDDRFRILVGGGRRRVQRQQTLQAALDWSHDLLSVEEQLVLRRLAVFAGGCTMGAVEGVCNDEALPARHVLSCLRSLVGKSLVVADTAAGATRYRLLETVRLYAQSRLADAGESEQFRDRHVEWYLAWTESFPSDVALFDSSVRRALLGEQDNLRAAVDWLVSQDRPELLARLTFASRQLWYNGWSEDGDRVLEPLLDDRRLEPRRLAEAHVTAGWYDFWRLRIDSMGRRASRAMELVGDPLDPLSMEATYAVWISSLSRLGYVRGRGALLAEDSTAPARSRALAVGLCESAAAAGHQRFLALGELASGVLDLLLDEEFDRSLAHFESAVAHADPDDMGFAIGHSHAATVLELQGRYDEALRHLDLARPVHAGTIFEYSSDLMEGIIRAHQGDASTAAGLLLRACTSVSGRVVNPSALIGVAVLASAVGEHARAGRLMATVVARGVPPLTFLLPYIAPAIREARAALGHDRANEVKVAGAALKLSDALQGELEWLASLAADR